MTIKNSIKQNKTIKKSYKAKTNTKEVRSFSITLT